MKRTLFLLLASLLMILASVPQGARALDTRPPRTVLTQGDLDLQEGRLGTYCWHYTSSPRYGVGMCADATRGFPPAASVVSGEELTIRIERAKRPDVVTLYAEALEDEPVSLIPAEDLAIELRPAATGWEVAFEVPLPCRHYYITMHARWERDAEDGGQVWWSFHVRDPSARMVPAAEPPACPV